jgi:hypothetical protein
MTVFNITARLAASGALSANPQNYCVIRASLTASGALSPGLAQRFSIIAAFTASGAVAAGLSGRFFHTAVLRATVSFAASPFIRSPLTAHATLAASSSVSSRFRGPISARAVLAATAALEDSPPVIFPAIPGSGEPAVTFAWVDPSEVEFDRSHIRIDEHVLAITMTHAEADFPTCDVTIKNPYVGLVGPGRKYWAWLAFERDGIFVPFFFGRLIATPDNIQDEAITLKFMARSRTWLKLKQHVADTLKHDPYDPIFVNVNKRADPDTALEFFSAVWHYDRVPSPNLSGGEVDLQVTTSDILEPEDGFLTFQANEHFYKSFNFTIGQQPLKTVLVRSDVKWTQHGAGRVDIGSGDVACWTGGSIISGWPKAGTQLNGGYTVVGASAFAGTEFASAISRHFTWENRNTTPIDSTGAVHHTGDAMSEDQSWTDYMCGGERIIYQVFSQPGVVDPSGSTTLVPFGTEPTGVNIPLHVQWSETLVCFWNVFTTLVMDYDAARPRHEKLEFSLNADLQPVFTDIHEPASVDTQVLSIPGSDVGLPIVNTKSWYTLFLANDVVPAGTVVVSTPEFVGGPLYAVAINSGGLVGTFEPDWSDVLGDIIIDGTVHWAMIGGDVPTDFATWRDVSDSQVVAGTVIRAQFYLPPPRDIFGHPLPAPPAGTSSFQIAITNGNTEIYSNGLNGIADLHPEWPEPRFSNVLGQTTQDGTVTWLCLGTGNETNAVIDIPLGLNTGARSYFPKDRGQRSIHALINMARAALRMRSRVIKIEFECTIERGLDLTCRKGVQIFDHRLPGGVAFGKITSYQLVMDGDKEEFIAKVTAECSPGFGASGGLASPGSGIIAVPGVGVYALDGYMQPGYQQTTGGTVPVNSGTLPTPTDFSSVGYTRPLDAPADDGLVFPITDAKKLIVDQRWITGRPPGAPEFVANAVLPITSKIVDPRSGTAIETTVLLPVPNGFTPVPIVENVVDNITGLQFTKTTIFYFPVTQYWLELKNLNRPYSTQYDINTTDLIVPEMINLQAEAQP